MTENFLLLYFKKAATMVAFLITILFMSEIMKAGAKENVPDFAFPEKVEKDADKVLKKSLEEKDDVMAIQSVVRIIAARNAVSADSFNRNVELIDSVAPMLRAPYSNLVRLLEATMYTQMYEGNSWQFNRRTLPLDSFPDNPMEWSGDLFAKKVLELVNESVADPDAARGISIDKIQPLLTNFEYAEKSGLTIADFISSRAALLLNNYAESPSQSVIPFFNNSEPLASGIREECGIRSKQIIDNLYEWRSKAGNVAALVFAIRQKIDLMPYDQRAAFLGEWVEKLADNKECAILLHDYMEYIPGDFDEEWKMKRKLYASMTNYLKRFSGSGYDSLIDFDLARLSMQKATIELPDKSLSATPVTGKLTAENMSVAYVLLYRVPESIVPMNSLNFKEFPAKASFIKAIKIDVEGNVPFSAEKDFELPPLTPGYYVVLPSSKPTLASDWSKKVDRWAISVLNVSDIAVITSMNRHEDKSGRLYVVDAASQRPIAGAEVKFYPDNSVKKVISRLFTDKEGCVAMPEGFLRVRASKGNSVIWQSSDFYYNKETSHKSKRASVLTDLSVYKPGDNVGFSVVAWTNEGHDNSLLKDAKLKVILRDANWNDIDTLQIITDEYGRSSGHFKLPESGLLGRYNICIGSAGDNDIFGSQSFQVAEYKAPSFFVSFDTESSASYEPGDTVSFTGRVLTFSGMPLAGLEVGFNVTWVAWWRWWSGGVDNASYSGKVMTGPDGRFTVKLPTESLKGTPYERGIFLLTATATSNSGETQTSDPLRFSLGNGFTIRPDRQDENLEVKSDTVRFNVPVYDILNYPVVKRVDYTVTDPEGKKLFGGSFESPVLEIPSSRLPSGKYQISFNLENDTVATDIDVILWRGNDVKPPVATPLWVPQDEVIVPAGAASVELMVGSGFAGSWILCQVSDENKIIERRWLPSDGVNVAVKIDAPESNSRCWVSFAGMHDFKGKVAKVALIPEESTKKMGVKTLSFRDKISAGDKEKWVFSFKVADELQGNIPAMAVMSNKALDAIYPFNWHLSLGSSSWYDNSFIRFTQKNNRSVSGTFTSLPRFRQPDISLPDWNTYNRLLAGLSRGGFMVRGGRRVMMKAQANVTSDDVVAESEDAELVENNVFYAADSKAEMAAVKSPQEGLKFELSPESDSESGNVNTGSGASDVKPRPIEMPLAFFMPSLTSDNNGNVDVEFITPDFNTTWKFQLAAYNEEMQTAGLTLETVASKPVMVQSNPPRYLRTGDIATVAATLFNNSPDPQLLHGRIEIFNPVTGEIIYSKHIAEEETAPGASRSFSIEFPVASDISALGVRAYAYAGNHADGEQTIIPVLPSSAPVIESSQFYLGAGKEQFKLKLPKFRKDASLTLKYCANPVWECLLALPEISTPASSNILSLSRAFYANTMASGIVEKYPEVRKGLEKVTASSDGEGKATLTSPLQKDSMLKTVALVNTPWVNNAEAETMRMMRLNELLDSKKLSGELKDLAKRISALQNPDGGWSWCEGMRSSEFITAYVLSDLSPLLAYDTTGEISGMAKKAIKYCDTRLYDDYLNNDKKFSTIAMLRYLYIRNAFDKSSGKAGFSTLKKEAISAIDKEWKSFSIYDKATAALLLNTERGYETTVRLILESLRQLASKSESKGWWFDNLSSGWSAMPKLVTTARALEAFSTIQPDTEAVEGLRQWLVLQKETQDWGDNSYTSSIINAIMSSGASWAQEATPPTIELDGKQVDTSVAEMLTGTLTVKLSPADASGKILTVNRSGSEGPAWGGVISQYVAPIAEVKAEKCENLKIEKQLLIVKEGEGATTVEKVKGPLKVGDKVRVSITVTCAKDMDYVALIDSRSSCLEPTDQLSGYRMGDGLGFYREIRDTTTSFFIGFLPKGVNVISYDCYVDREGEYALGIASVQSQYSPLQAAHSAGGVVKVGN